MAYISCINKKPQKKLYRVVLFLFFFIFGLAASALTFLTGFGLGTVLLPVFSLFFDVELAIMMTAIVHFVNNIFKIWVVRPYIQWRIGIYFASVSIPFALVGSLLFGFVQKQPFTLSWSLASYQWHTSAIQIIIGTLIVVFVLWDRLMSQKHISITNGIGQYIVGGALTGFFGGLSGLQGALRALFLHNLLHDKKHYIATGVFIALCVDMSRLPVYMSGYSWSFLTNIGWFIIVTLLGALLGVIVGRWGMVKIKNDYLDIIIETSLIAIGVCMILGIV